MVLWIYLLYAVLLSVVLGRAGHRGAQGRVSRKEGRRPARVLIIGATGGTGRHLVAQALARGLQVTALVRDPAKLGPAGPHIRVIKGDVLDRAAVHAAMEGQDAVLSALGHRRYFAPTRILSTGTAHILDAMQAHGVSRFVCETSLGIGDSAGRMGLYYTFIVIPLVLPLYFWDKARQERIIAESDTEWVIVRPTLLTNASGRGEVRHGSRVGSFLLTKRIAREDVAKFMLDQLGSDAFLRTATGVSW